MCGSRPWGAAAFHLCFFILLLKCVTCSPVPASFFLHLNIVTLVPIPGRKEGHAVREPSLLRGIAVLRRSGSRKKRRSPVAARSGGAGAMEEGGGNRQTFNTFNNNKNKHKWKAAAPHGRLPHTKHKLKFQAWSSLVFHCCHSSFNPSEAPPWDSRPVSGAGVVHYQLLHRPRSVPTALGPAPLATNAHIRSSTVVYVSKSHARKKTLRNLYVPGSEIFGTEILCYTSK